MLDNKVALITGAASGIGAAIARLFAENGAAVVLADVDEAGSKKVLRSITEAGGKGLFVKTDTSKPAANEKAVQRAVGEFGGLDIAVNNAGIGGKQATAGEYPLDSWDKVIAINLSGVFYGMHYQIPEILKREGGSIINMASILGQVGTAMSSAYVAAKHGVVGLTQAAALEYAGKGLRINSIGPGYIKTPLLTDNLDEEAMEGLIQLHPIGRLGEAREVAELALWLASEKASFVTGAYYNVDGGYLAR